MILDPIERAVMGEMQLRGQASFRRSTLEGLVQAGSTQVFDQALTNLVAMGLVVTTRFSPQLPAEFSLSATGRSFKVEGDEPPPPPPPLPAPTLTETDRQIIAAPDMLFGGPSLAEVFQGSS